VRVRWVGVVIQTLLNRAHKYIGQSSLDGLTLVSRPNRLAIERQTAGKGGRWKVIQLSSEGPGEVLRRPPGGLSRARESYIYMPGGERPSIACPLRCWAGMEVIFTFGRVQ
jgi:hypothetical protein